MTAVIVIKKRTIIKIGISGANCFHLVFVNRNISKVANEWKMKDSFAFLITFSFAAAHMFSWIYVKYAEYTKFNFRRVGLSRIKTWVFLKVEKMINNQVHSATILCHMFEYSWLWKFNLIFLVKFVQQPQDIH